MIERRETSPQKVRDNIFSLIKIRKVTRKEVQRACGFSNGFFVELSKDSRKHYPDTKNLLAICEYFGITIEELLYKDYQAAADSRRIQEIDAEVVRLKKERERITDGMIDRARKRREIEKKMEADQEQ